MRPKVAILRAAGVNCDVETAYAFQQAGAEPFELHINKLIQEPARLDEADMLAIPGGFSYGDDISAGKILANQMVHHLGEAMRAFIAAGKPVIGICNGFQVLVKTGLLPGPIGDKTGQTVTLWENTNRRFVDRWVTLQKRSPKCIWTRELPESIDLPIAHREGRVLCLNEDVRQALWDGERVALTYLLENPNGSVDSIAGICDDTGLVLGLMPHPERYTQPQNHPNWSRLKFDADGALPATSEGLAIFRSAVNHVTNAAASSM